MTLLDDVITGASGDVPIATLLRQVKILASRTRAIPLETWVRSELDGYDEAADLPPYRGPIDVVALGHFMGPFQSELQNVPIPRSSFPSDMEADDLFRIHLRRPIAEVENMSQQKDTAFGWSADIVKVYNHGVQVGKIQRHAREGMVLVGVKLPIPQHMFVGVLDAVRNKVLDLALELERVTPAAGEATASGETQGLAGVIINNHFHAMSNVAIGSAGVKQVIKPPARSDADDLIRFLAESGLSSDLLTELRAEVEADQAKGSEPGKGRWPRVRSWFARVATESGTEAVGGAIATAATSFLG